MEENNDSVQKPKRQGENQNMEDPFSSSTSYLEKVYSDPSLISNLDLEAATFYGIYQKWNRWLCLFCDRKFINSESHLLHVVRSHLRIPFVTALIPLEISPNWIEIINEGNWKPAEIDDSWQMIIRRRETLASDSNNWEVVSGFKPQQYYFGMEWPLSSDNGRLTLLNEIQQILKTCLSNGDLSSLHIHHATGLALHMLESSTESLEFNIWGKFLPYDLGLGETHFCFCLLEVKQLETLLGFFKAISQCSCEPSKERAHADIDGMTSEHNLASWIVHRKKMAYEELQKIKEFCLVGAPATTLMRTKRRLFDKQLSKSNEWIIQFGKKFQLFETRINSIAAIDYREILFYLMKESQDKKHSEGHDVYPLIKGRMERGDRLEEIKLLFAPLQSKIISIFLENENNDKGEKGSPSSNKDEDLESLRKRLYDIHQSTPLNSKESFERNLILFQVCIQKVEKSTRKYLAEKDKCRDEHKNIEKMISGLRDDLDKHNKSQKESIDMLGIELMKQKQRTSSEFKNELQEIVFKINEKLDDLSASEVVGINELRKRQQESMSGLKKTLDAVNHRIAEAAKELGERTTKLKKKLKKLTEHADDLQHDAMCIVQRGATLE